MHYITLYVGEAEKFNGLSHAMIHADERFKPEKITERDYGLRDANGDWLSNLRFYIFFKKYIRQLRWTLSEGYKVSLIHGTPQDINFNIPTMRQAWRDYNL